MDSVWLDGLAATPEAREGGGAACVSRGAVGWGGQRGRERVCCSRRRHGRTWGLGCPGGLSATVPPASLPGVASVGLQRPHSEFPSGTDLWALGSKLKHECWEEGEKERRGVQNAVLNSNADMLVKHSICRGGLCPGPMPPPHPPKDRFCLFCPNAYGKLSFY